MVGNDKLCRCSRYLRDNEYFERSGMEMEVELVNDPLYISENK